MDKVEADNKNLLEHANRVKENSVQDSGEMAVLRERLHSAVLVQKDLENMLRQSDNVRDCMEREMHRKDELYAQARKEIETLHSSSNMRGESHGLTHERLKKNLANKIFGYLARCEQHFGT